MQNSITDILGLEVGHDTNLEAITGCTVVLCEGGAVCGVDVRGYAPGTRETALLNPLCTVENVHAILLTGGSAFGLDAASGVMRYLEERGAGFDTGVARVPIVPAAVVFDLAIGRADVRPNAESGYRACQDASAARVPEGSVGVGTGATVGKMLGPMLACKSGVGSASLDLGAGLYVGALAAVNAVGDVYDPETGRQIAGPRNPEGVGFLSSLALLASAGHTAPPPGTNTTVGVVATNARLTKVQVTRIAQMAHDGLALAVRPVHTMLDGDTVFCLATGGPDDPPADVNILGAMAVQVMARAIARAVTQATSLGGIPAVGELGQG